MRLHLGPREKIRRVAHVTTDIIRVVRRVSGHHLEGPFTF